MGREAHELAGLLACCAMLSWLFSLPFFFCYGYVTISMLLECGIRLANLAIHEHTHTRSLLQISPILRSLVVLSVSLLSRIYPISRGVCILPSPPRLQDRDLDTRSLRLPSLRTHFTIRIQHAYLIIIPHPIHSAPWYPKSFPLTFRSPFSLGIPPSLSIPSSYLLERG